MDRNSENILNECELIRKSKRINFTYENISLITSQFFSFFFLYIIVFNNTILIIVILVKLQ